MQYIQWNPEPVAFALGPLSIKWYGILWAAGILSTYMLGVYMMRVLKRSEEHVALMVQYVFIGGLVGARLWQVIYYEPAFFMSHPEKIFAVWQGGLASHGGLAGAMLALVLFCRRHKEYQLLWMFDHAAICVLFLASFIRFGNLLNSEIVGTPTQAPWAFVFTGIDNIPRHPVVLYESIAYFALQFLILFLFKKYKDSRPGIYMMLFFVLVFSTRFMLEFLKEPEGALVFGLISKTQLLNLPFITVGLVLLPLVIKNKLRYKT